MKTYEKYKDSGVEWIGDIPEHWEVRKLKRVCQVKRGASPRPIDSPKYFDDNGEFGWVRISDVTRSERYLEETQQYLSKLGTQCSVKMYPNDIFLSIAGSVGKAIITKVKCCIHDGFVWFKGLKIDTEFLYYIFQISRIYEGLGKEGTQLNLNTETIGSVTIPFISISEQQKIASYLDKKSEAIDQFIKNKESLINLLEEEKKAIITKAVTKGLDKDVKLKDSGVEWLGEIPEHWEVRKLKYLGNFKSGESITSEKINYSGCYPVFGGNGLRGYTSSYTHDGSYILIGRQGALCGNVNYVDGKIFASEHAVVINTKNNITYIGELLKIMNLNQYSQSAAQPGLAVDTIKNIFTVVPILSEQQSIATHLDEQIKKIDDLKAKYRQEIDLIKEYKERLIYDVVTGKINVMQE